MQTHNGIVYRADWAVVDRNFQPPRPLRVVFLTSIRDVGMCDRNGWTVETPEGPCYMEGVIEHAVSRLKDRMLSSVMEIAGVITDDLAGETADYPILPKPDMPWIHPLDLALPNGVRVADLTVNIPSAFRRLALSDLQGRALAKQRFELTVLRKMRELRADVLISDHYMARIEHLVNGLGWFGRVLNIHPALTIPGHPHAFPGKTPTADAIAKAAKQEGVMTGATFHIMDTIIDHGPALTYQCSTEVRATDEPQHLRARNYPTKCRVFAQGMVHYAKHIYPHLDRIDFGRMTERAWIRGK